MTYSNAQVPAMSPAIHGNADIIGHWHKSARLPCSRRIIPCALELEAHPIIYDSKSANFTMGAEPNLVETLPIAIGRLNSLAPKGTGLLSLYPTFPFYTMGNSCISEITNSDEHFQFCTKDSLVVRFFLENCSLTCFSKPYYLANDLGRNSEQTI